MNQTAAERVLHLLEEGKRERATRQRYEAALREIALGTGRAAPYVKIAREALAAAQEETP